MEKELVKQLKQAAKDVYYFLLKKASGDYKQKNIYREQFFTIIEGKDIKDELKRFGMNTPLIADVMKAINDDDKKAAFGAFLITDWDGYFTYDDINLYSLQKFFEERPALSLSAISTQAGLSDKYIRLILAEERNLTESVKAKLKPVLMLYGWGDRPTKQN